MMTKARIIAQQIEKGMFLGDVLSTHGFGTSMALGNYMRQQGYRFIVSKHRYVYDETLFDEPFDISYQDTGLQERLTEKKLITALEAQVETMKEILAGAYPIKLASNTEQKLLEHCKANNLSVDEFVGEAILEKIGKSER